MITDKDREDANVVFTLHAWSGNKYAAIEISRIRRETAEQARKEAAERVCKACQKETPCKNNCRTIATILGEVKK